VGDGVPIRSNEQASGVLADAKRGVLDLVIVDVAVKPDDDGSYLGTQAVTKIITGRRLHGFDAAHGLSRIIQVAHSPLMSSLSNL
jgi:hypothetical protein